MKLLADAHISRLIIAFLERMGHNVMRASSFPGGTSDDEILRTANTDGRIVLTSDKDFGELVFRQKQAAAGIILLRIDVAHETERAAIFEQFWPHIEQAVPSHFVVVTSKAVRRSPLPSGMA